MKVVLIAFTNIEYTIELAEGLSKRIELILMLPKNQVTKFKNAINDKVKVKAFEQPRLRQLSNLIFIFKMYKIIKEYKPDILHIQRGHPWFNFILPFFKNISIVTTIHDVIQHTGDLESKKIPAFTHQIAIKYASQIIVHGNALKEEMLRESGKDKGKINVLHRGINSIYNRYQKNLHLCEKDTVLFFGRIFEYKGLRYLIEAEPIISKQIPDLKIVIAGRGENFKEKYERFIVNKSKFTVYNEHISNDMVGILFQKASVVALPYIDASQSGVVPLAYSFKKPVVVTNVGSLPEVVVNGKTGYIVPPKDSKTLANAIIKILSNDDMRKKMGEYCGEMAHNELSWDRIAEKTIKVYEKAVSNR